MGFYYLKIFSCHFKIAILRLFLIGAKKAISGVWGLYGPFLINFVQFVHPYIVNLHGSVLFFAGIAGKKKEATEVEPLEREV